jgi:hypothetical protein
MRGGDNQAGFAVRNPSGQYVMPYQWKAHAEYDESSIQTPGKLFIHVFHLFFSLQIIRI